MLIFLPSSILLSFFLPHPSFLLPLLHLVAEPEKKNRWATFSDNYIKTKNEPIHIALAHPHIAIAQVSSEDVASNLKNNKVIN